MLVNIKDAIGLHIEDRLAQHNIYASPDFQSGAIPIRVPLICFDARYTDTVAMPAPPPSHPIPDRDFTPPNPFPGSTPRRLIALSLDTHLPPLSAFTPTKDIRYHPLFQGLLFPWVWRVWTQRFTKAGHYFVIATLFFTAFSSVSLDQQFYVAFAYALGLWAVAFLGMWLGRPRVSLTATLPERVQAGETLKADVSVTAGGGRGIGLSILPDRLPPDVDAVSEDGAELPTLAPGETTRVSVALSCKKRGVFQLRGFRVETAFPLGLMVAQSVFAESRTLWVTPRFTPLGRMDIPHGRRYQPGGTASALRLGDSFEFIGNREYRDGDPVRAIDWRATARLNRPVVREYREEFLQRVTVVLDTHAPSPPGLPPPPAFESAVSLTAAVCEYCARSEFALDVLAAGPNIHTLAGPGQGALASVLDLLAEVSADTRMGSGTDWSRLEEELMVSAAQTTLIVCVFLDWDAARQEFAERLRDFGAGLKILVIRDTLTTLPPGEWPSLTSAQITAGMDEI